MSERIRGALRNALYRYTYTLLLYFFGLDLDTCTVHINGHYNKKMHNKKLTCTQISLLHGTICYLRP